MVPFEPIGMVQSDGFWEQTTNTDIGKSSRGGTAFGFRLTEEYNVSTIRGFLRGYGDWDTGGLQMSLIRGSSNFRGTSILVPTNDIIFETERFTFPLDQSIHPVDHQVNARLAPNDYWINYNGSASFGSLNFSHIEIDGESLAGGVHTPEPGTLLLLGGGLLGALRFRKK